MQDDIIYLQSDIVVDVIVSLPLSVFPINHLSDRQTWSLEVLSFCPYQPSMMADVVDPIHPSSNPRLPHLQRHAVRPVVDSLLPSFATPQESYCL